LGNNEHLKVNDMRYPDLPTNRLELEEEVLDRWRTEEVFQQTLSATEGGEKWVFYEGPPTANGRPGLHHIISRTIKDLFCRYRTMQGYSVTRIAGWDTHGLPVEIEAEKRLGISGKPEIEALGIEEFNQACRDSVFTYKKEWEDLSDRIGYWLDYSRPYETLSNNYVESVWWILKQLADRDLLYRGHKSVPYCPRCGTALSSHEVAQGYKDIEDASLFFLCPWLTSESEPDPDNRSFLVWTTTPWTVPSNSGLAANPDLTYAQVEWEGKQVVLAEDRVEAVFGEDAEILARYPGAELAGLRYARPLEVTPMPDDPQNGWTVVLEEFVSASDGTGLVHMAPAFGSDDYAAGQRHGLPLINPLDDAGHFVESVDLVGGMFVKDADPLLVTELEKVGNLFEAGRHTHSYPHCWRCESPLLYIARQSWFARTSTVKDQMLASNDSTNWHPPETGVGRMGEWLKGNIDWALSRERYWGTPLPAWVCDRNETHVQWVGSYEELGEKAGTLHENFDPHRPFIDEFTWECTDCDGTMCRTPEVVDAWFDSGSMPYAQWHYPFENGDQFESHFPADFICEGLDQTRGWFYSLVAIGTMLGMGKVYKNVVVNDLILDANGQKMSKSRGNAVDPWDAINEHGADAIRWYLITSSNPWLPKRYDSEGLREAARKYFDTLLNTYKFFTLYANVEDWVPSDLDAAPADRPLIDRWLLSRLNSVVRDIRAELDAYQITPAYRMLSDFLNEELSNWYVRRNRSRFWGNASEADSRAAFRTLWDALRTVALLGAPATPFTADWIHGALTNQTVHLQDFPVADEGAVDTVLEAEMSAVRALVSLGRAAREEVQIRVRQPLRTIQAVIPSGVEIRPDLLDLLKDELNVKAVDFLSSADGLVELSARPNYRALGSRFRKATEQAAGEVRGLSAEDLAKFLAGDEVIICVNGEEHVLQTDDLEVVESSQGELVVKSEYGHTVGIDPTLDAELISEGLAREIVNRVQRLRKDSGLEITDRIELGVFGHVDVVAAAETHREFICGEVLALQVVASQDGPGEGDGKGGAWAATLDVDLDGRGVTVCLRPSGRD
jgi:isoleucyl-tRNA synthetase